jgi:hypothetical protein
MEMPSAEDLETLSDEDGGGTMTTQALADLAELDNLAYELTARSLREYGNELSPAHCDVLRDAAVILGLLANGSVTGRYVFTLPAGLGKTRLLVCWIKAMVSLGFPYSVAVCAARVQELIDIKHELMEGEHPVPKDLIGLWHSLEDALEPPTFTKEEAEAGMYATRRILLLTHARMQKGEELTEWLQYENKPRDLVFYDESLLTTGYWQAPYPVVAGELAMAAVLAGTGSRTAVILQDFLDTLHRETANQENGEEPSLIKLPEEITRSGTVRDQLDKMLTPKMVRKRLTHLRELFFHNNREADVRLVVAQNPAHSILIRPYSTVPTKELDRMIILDASYLPGRCSPSRT